MADGGDERTFGLVMPFVVCATQGGPYEDAAFVAGAYFGKLDRILANLVVSHYDTVPSPLVPQLDLLAMHHGLVMHVEPWDEHPDEWTFVRFERPSGGG